MDKETLSNYGWIVICILVLSVMIALATPFGRYIKTAVENTTQGLFDVSQKAGAIAGLDLPDQNFEDGGGGSAEPDEPEQNEQQEPTADNLFGVWVFNDVIPQSSLISAKGSYTVNFTCVNALSNTDYHKFQIVDAYPVGYSIMYINQTTSRVFDKNGWYYDIHKTVDFGTEGQSVSADFFTWLTENATYQG